ncbi:hypothetical protein KV134_03645 [Tetragenococcus halophilus]|uniref:Uncharacterized protein n=1 Tax=Tetragenococcus halophilus (strain DSM 20338 / JCM 20259 / NCIMB 9735 / NBRC 12172) TaxID=945021 RepID=A0AAN1SHV1_TETHN|nr:hypothetical protein [Tetragenococcus halophilus]AOF49243.1 hypothetical protein AC806_07515 [Tetragenococcus halophilus]MCO8284614.1 hypothetical protein [Tetragenococcus halophilus]NRR75533.1 hypothetical protein [Tetragenococcus halophilus]NWO01167.1 hypothetical protein [Tetragenococcus halophilus]QXN87506.1 hypothetical protein KV134_03645 [Tetragenococcus halophilus]
MDKETDKTLSKNAKMNKEESKTLSENSKMNKEIKQTLSKKYSQTDLYKKTEKFISVWVLLIPLLR